LVDIEFICDPAVFGDIPKPSAAVKSTPAWYQKLPRNLGGKNRHDHDAKSVKACLPFLDAMSMGWMIPLPFDVHSFIDPKTNLRQFRWAVDAKFAPVGAHSSLQLGGEAGPYNGRGVFKWINPWRMIVPRGWSVLFRQPVHHEQLPFRAFSGVVDCDTLDIPVNVPFMWTGERDNEVIPAGTPIAQIMAFERETQQQSAIVRAASSAERAAADVAKDALREEPATYGMKWRHPRKRG
jgi:hypothetical protein